MQFQLVYCKMNDGRKPASSPSKLLADASEHDDQIMENILFESRPIPNRVLTSSEVISWPSMI